jgi:hypothetical protein
MLSQHAAVIIGLLYNICTVIYYFEYNIDLLSIFGTGKKNTRITGVHYGFNMDFRLGK